MPKPAVERHLARRAGEPGEFYGLTVLMHNSGHFGPPLPFWPPVPGIAGAADG